MSKKKKKRGRQRRRASSSPGALGGQAGASASEPPDEEVREDVDQESSDEGTERRPGPLRSWGAGGPGRGKATVRGTGATGGRRTAVGGRARPAGRGARARRPQEPQPPILAPLARSLILVGSSPPILATAFLSVLVIWLIYSSTGIIRIASPATMAQIQSLLPVHSLLDLQFMFAGLRVSPPALAIGLSAVLLLIRAAFLSLLLGLIFLALDRRVTPESWGEQLRLAGRRAFSAFQFVFAIEAGMVVAVYALSSILGTFFGALGLVLALIIEMYLLVLSPVVAAAERLGAGASVRLSIRAARLRGPQHLMLAFVYVFSALYVVIGLRGTAAAPATPSIGVWAYVMFATYVHVSLLAALAYRWLLVRGVVGADDERAGNPRPRRARAAR